MTNDVLIQFIIEARKRKYGDKEIRRILLEKGWFQNEIEEAMRDSRREIKKGIIIYLEESVLNSLEKRAKKNMLSLPEQIEDIARRSCLNIKKKLPEDKCDDKLVSIFSRAKRGRKINSKLRKKK